MKRAASEDLMTRLFGIIYALAGPTLAGILITAALTMNMINTKAMIYAAAIGFIVALPIAWVVAKQIKENA
ncbi:CTP synthetase [Rhodobacter sp. TJ_12]|uniref:CTP synthetase n=1 Tax=Rhodobacter sp. TJ_12 TaxID=2029399 RepID=UPI001CBAC198|nr:CTP synthetase [Rhodobacter sp. TJ_12]